MGTTLHRDESLLNFIHPSQKLANDLVKLLAHKFQEGHLTMGYRVEEGKPEAKYAITDSEFENVFLELRCREVRGLHRYEVALFTMDGFADLPVSFTAQLPDELLEALPEQMINNLEEELDRLLCTLP